MKKNKIYIIIKKYNLPWENYLTAFAQKKLNINTTKNDIKKNESGKPFCANFHFSISHSKDLLAIGISDNINIGIDLQIEKIKVDKERLLNKIATEKEKLITNLNTKDLIKLWTKKESLFKLIGNLKTFFPKKLDTTSYFFISKEFQFNNENFILTVCHKSNIKNIEVEYILNEIE